MRNAWDDLRHTFAKALLDPAAYGLDRPPMPLPAIQHLLGHADIATTTCAGYLRHPYRKIGRCAKKIMKEQPSQTGPMSHLLKRAGLISSESSRFAHLWGEKHSHKEILLRIGKRSSRERHRRLAYRRHLRNTGTGHRVYTFLDEAHAIT